AALHTLEDWIQAGKFVFEAEQIPDGARMEPSVSVLMEKPASPAAVAEPLFGREHDLPAERHCSAWFNEKGNPTSLTFAGSVFGETAMLSLAKAYQDATDWH